VKALLPVFLSSLKTNGAAVLLVSCCMFTASNSFIKGACGFFSSGEIAFARFAIGGLLLTPVLIHRKTRLHGQDLPVLVIFGLCATATFFTFMLAIRHCGLAVAGMLLYTSPVWALTLGAFFLKERLTLTRCTGIAVAFIGIVTLIDPRQASFSMGHLFGLAVGFFGGGNYVLTRHLRVRHDAFLIYAVRCCVGTLASLPLIMGSSGLLQWHQSLPLLIPLALFGLLAHVTMAHGFRYIYAADGATLMMAEAVFTAVVGILFFKEPLTIQFIIGALLILGNGLYLGLKTHKELLRPVQRAEDGRRERVIQQY